jgi:CHAD domain-containing protein
MSTPPEQATTEQTKQRGGKSVERELKSSAADAKKLLLDPNAPLAEGLARALERILGYAVASARRVEVEPKKAVHEFRKSIRRARALVKLSGSFVGKRARKELDAVLKRAVTPTSLLRDIDVLLGHVAQLKSASPEMRDGLGAKLCAEREARNLPPAGVVLGTSSAAVASLGERFAAALPEELANKTLNKALRRSYKAARHALAEARGGAGDRDVAIHRFRKRVKELRYQLELLRGVVVDTEALKRQADLAEALGSVTDLLVLREYVQGCGLAVDAQELIGRLSVEIETQRSTVLDGAAELFAPKSKAFVRTLLGPQASERSVS